MAVGERPQAAIGGHHSHRSPEGIHPYLLRVPDIEWRKGDNQGSPGCGGWVDKIPGQSVGQGYEQNPKYQRQKGQRKLGIACQTGPEMERQVVSRRVDISGSMRNELGDRLTGQKGADGFIVPEAFRTQPVEPEREPNQQTGNQDGFVNRTGCFHLNLDSWHMTPLAIILSQAPLPGNKLNNSSDSIYLTYSFKSSIMYSN